MTDRIRALGIARPRRVRQVLPVVARRLALPADDVCRNITSEETADLVPWIRRRALAGLGPTLAAGRGSGVVNGGSVFNGSEFRANHDFYLAATCLEATSPLGGSRDGLDCGGMVLGCRIARRRCAGGGSRPGEYSGGRRIANPVPSSTTGILERALGRSRIAAPEATRAYTRRCRSLAPARECPATNGTPGRSPAVVESARRTVRLGDLGRRSTTRIGQDSAVGTRTPEQDQRSPVPGGLIRKALKNPNAAVGYLAIGLPR